MNVCLLVNLQPLLVLKLVAVFVESICNIFANIVGLSYCMAANLARSLLKKILNLNETSWLNKCKIKINKSHECISSSVCSCHVLTERLVSVQIH